MSNSPLDEVSFQLGQLNAGQAMLLKRAEKRDNQMEDIAAKITEIKNCIEPLVKKVEFMEPQVRHYAGVRRHAVWVGGAIVTFGGWAGGLVGTWLVKKYS